MYIILGGTGHVGSAAAEALLRRGAAVTVVGHDAGKAGAWEARGARFATVDVGDGDALRTVLRTGRRAFLLNPPAAPDTDTDAEERRTAAAIVAALDGSGLEKVVAASTYGVRPGAGVGDLSVLHAFETALMRQPIPVAINRGAYYFSNWDATIGPAREDGTLPSMFPAAFALPMVAPQDLGIAAARRLMEPAEATGVHHVEGPDRYTPADVAAEFARVLEREVRVAVTPRAEFETAFRALGFSDAAAASYARMTEATIDDPREPDEPIERGTVTLRAYVTALAERVREEAGIRASP